MKKQKESCLQSAISSTFEMVMLVVGWKYYVSFPQMCSVQTETWTLHNFFCQVLQTPTNIFTNCKLFYAKDADYRGSKTFLAKLFPWWFLWPFFARATPGRAPLWAGWKLKAGDVIGPGTSFS